MFQYKSSEVIPQFLQSKKVAREASGLPNKWNPPPPERITLERRCSSVHRVGQGCDALLCRLDRPHEDAEKGVDPFRCLGPSADA